MTMNDKLHTHMDIRITLLTIKDMYVCTLSNVLYYLAIISISTACINFEEPHQIDY